MAFALIRPISSISPSPTTFLAAEIVPEIDLLEVQDTGLISLEIIIFPVSILHKTSHQEVFSAKAGLQTPAMNPGLRLIIQ